MGVARAIISRAERHGDRWVVPSCVGSYEAGPKACGWERDGAHLRRVPFSYLSSDCPAGCLPLDGQVVDLADVAGRDR